MQRTLAVAETDLDVRRIERVGTHADRRQRLGACVFQRRQQRLQRRDGGQQGGVVAVLEGRAVDRQGRDADGVVRCGEDGLFAVAKATCSPTKASS